MSEYLEWQNRPRLAVGIGERTMWLAFFVGLTLAAGGGLWWWVRLLTCVPWAAAYGAGVWIDRADLAHDWRLTRGR